MKIQKAALATLAYTDVFAYPLTAKELYRFLIADEPSSYSSFKTALTRINSNRRQIKTKGEYYYLGSRKELADLRKSREKWSRRKIKKAEKVAKLLQIIPYMKLVGITGSLAILNAEQNDDIDFLIVSAKKRLWLTRLLTIFLVELTGQRRRPPQGPQMKSKIKDKICLNMFLDEEHLAVPEKERDLFSAHEVIQMRPLWDKDETYQKFLLANQWVKNYLPNAFNLKDKRENISKAFLRINRVFLRISSLRLAFLRIKTAKKKENFFRLLLIFICSFSFFIFHFSFWEALFKRLQLWYMKKRRTTEVISEGIIRFHPQDARGWIEQEYSRRLKKLGLVH